MGLFLLALTIVVLGWSSWIGANMPPHADPPAAFTLLVALWGIALIFYVIGGLFYAVFWVIAIPFKVVWWVLSTMVSGSSSEGTSGGLSTAKLYSGGDTDKWWTWDGSTLM